MEGNDNNNNENNLHSNSNNEQEGKTVISDNSFVDMKFLRIFIVIDGNNNLTDSISFLMNSKDTVQNVIKEAVIQYNKKLSKQKAMFFINKNHQNYMLMFSLSGGMPDLNKQGPCENKEINSFDENEFTLVWKDAPSNYNVYIISTSNKKICHDNCVII